MWQKGGGALGLETKQLLGNVYDILSSADGKTRMDKFINETLWKAVEFRVCYESEETKRKKNVLGYHCVSNPTVSQNYKLSKLILTS